MRETLFTREGKFFTIEGNRFTIEGNRFTVEETNFTIEGKRCIMKETLLPCRENITLDAL